MNRFEYVNKIIADINDLLKKVTCLCPNCGSSTLSEIRYMRRDCAFYTLMECKQCNDRFVIKEVLYPAFFGFMEVEKFNELLSEQDNF